MLKYLKSYAEKSATRYTQLVPESLDTNDGLLKCIGAGFAIGAAGDQIAQRLELDDLEQAAHGATPTTPPTPPKLSTPPTTSVFLDWRRSIAWGVYLGGLNGVLIRSWYFHLEKRFGSAVVPKLIADQLIMAPVSTIMCLGFTGLLQEYKADGRLEWSLLARIKSDLPTIWATDMLFWPLANGINFTQIPLVYRPVFTSCADLVWQTFLSFYTMDIADMGTGGPREEGELESGQAAGAGSVD